MSKAAIYLDLIETKTLILDDTIAKTTKPYILNVNKILSNPKLFDNITLLIEKTIQNNNINFDTICATSISAIPYATNVATSLEKPFCFINNTTVNTTANTIANTTANTIIINDGSECGNISNLKVEGKIDIDNKILLIDTYTTNYYMMENIITKLQKYGSRIVGIILVFNLCEGEYINLINKNEKVFSIISLYDILNHLDNNNLIEMFYSEKIKFYCEKENKINLRKIKNE